MRIRMLWLVCVLLGGCTSVPEGITPVNQFELNRYLGKWYEIARFDHSFERGLSQVTANYSMREDGGVRVINRGYHAQNGEWEQAEGRAYFVQSDTVGHLKVSFFGPFYASYVIAELDQTEYRYSLVTGPDRDYLWILSRTPTMQEEEFNQLLKTATELGFDVNKLIKVSQESI